MELVRGGLGKLPSQPEFIRMAAGGREAMALDQWIQEGLHTIRREFGTRWEALYDHRLMHRFIYRADNCGQTLVGAIRAAMDSHERRYPFASFCLMPTQFLDTHPLLLPTLNDGIFLPLEQTIVEAAGISNLPALKNYFANPLPLAPPHPTMEQRYQTFLDEVEVGELGYFGNAGVQTMLRDLISTLQSNFNHPRNFTHVIELPLEQVPYARGLEIRFWLEVVMSALQWFPPTFSLFWATGDPPPRTGSLFMTLRQPPGKLMGTLLQSDGNSQGIWRPGLPNAGVPRGRLPALKPFREQDSLRALLCTIQPDYPRGCKWYQPG